MKVNKKEHTQEVISMTKDARFNCTKLQLDNVVFPKWSDLGLMGLMFRQCVVTKEQPDGNIYDEAKFQTVLRVIGGKLLMTGRPDCYCWNFSKLEKAKNVLMIGTNSADGIINMCELLRTIENENEKSMFADMFANLNKDLLLVTTPAEKRIAVEVTAELYAAGLTHCVDEWMECDPEGNAEATTLCVGDFLIITDSGVYCIRRDEFLETHSF